MRQIGHLAVIGGMSLLFVIAASGCNGTGAGGADGGANYARRARLLEDENSRLSDRIKSLEKEIAELKSTIVALHTQQQEHDQAVEATMNLLMEQIADKDAEIARLKERLGEK